MSKRLLSIICMMFFTINSSAFAVETEIPAFDAGKTVQVTGSIANANPPLNLDSDLATKIAEQEKANNLHIYLIVTEQGDELTGDRKSWAPELLHTRVWQEWSASSDFSEAYTVVVLWVRSKTDANQHSIAVRVGSGLHALGIDRSLLSSDNGPVRRALKQYLPGDPQEAILALLKNINSEMVTTPLVVQSAPAGNGGMEDRGGNGGGDSSWLFWLVGGALALVAMIMIGGIISGPSNSLASGSSLFGRRVGESSYENSGPSPAYGGDKKKKKKDGGDSGGSDTSSPAATCGGSSGGGDSGGGSSCGGSSCGGGGCGGGGCGGGGCGGG